ncbi:hypothetical protein [Microcoleus sp. w1-18aA5]|uniref:hypothetical protein n=1 Tax=Microcoleus sp. w1-18aA5 TaxID=2818982 RepID=UPI002FD62C6E
MTSGVVLLNMLMAFIAFSVTTFESLSLMIFLSGTVGGAASNYRRLQEAYVQQLRKPTPEFEPPITYIIEKNKFDEFSVVEKDVTKSQINLSELGTNTPIIEQKSTLIVLKLQIFLSPLFGGLFAFVLYGIFASGIIQGELFPKFKGSGEEYSTPYKFADNTLPATNADTAKAILWAFVARFAEGFVPNFIDKLVKDGEQKNN